MATISGGGAQPRPDSKFGCWERKGRMREGGSPLAVSIWPNNDEIILQKAMRLVDRRGQPRAGPPAYSVNTHSLCRAASGLPSLKRYLQPGSYPLLATDLEPTATQPKQRVWSRNGGLTALRSALCALRLRWPVLQEYVFSGACFPQLRGSIKPGVLGPSACVPAQEKAIAISSCG
jgi:hypothetical protein